MRSARHNSERRRVAKLGVDDLRQRAIGGDVAAQARLGVMYATGNGLPRDHSKALLWLQPAGGAGSIEAQYCLGLQYEHGRGVDVDNARALQWYCEAGSAGHAAAQCNVGIMHLRGLGTSEDRAEAAPWFVNAAAQGNVQALENLDWLREHRDEMSPSGQFTLLGFRDRADQNDPDALLLLGWANEAGFGVPVNIDEARQYYKRAQSKGRILRPQPAAPTRPEWRRLG